MDASKPATVVLGAGVVGLSAALYLQRSGHVVTVIDPMPPAGGTSYGNSGLISSDTAVPIALPGMLQKVPGWLSDREGPLIVHPSYLPQALPWLMRWIAASRMSRVLQISDAMRALHRGSLDCWREMLGPEHFADLIRPVGQIRIWEGEGGGYQLMNNISNRFARRVVVATGAWTRELLDPLGINVPLETERGYHLMMPSPNITLKIPMSIKNRGFGLTPMEDGLRAGGTVEIGGLRAPPDERRAMVLMRHVKRVFPTLEAGEPSLWMGHRPSTPDSLPILGEAPRLPGLFLAFGHGHFGMTGGPPSARLVAQLINGDKPAFDPLPYSCSGFN